MQLYNTLTRKKEPVRDSEQIAMYTCGPTVYLTQHVGNWRAFILYDTLARALALEGKDVRHVWNITDVGHLVSDEDSGQDKLTKTAQEQRITAWQVAEKYTEQFLSGLRDLNILKPYKLPKATDHIHEQIQMVQQLEDKGFTYTIDDGVYFDVSKLADYGKLYGGTIDSDNEFARIAQNDQKRNAQDFALWKLSPADEQRDMEWESPWGVGFPGWHIECSAMARKYLGNTIDIHAGGIDHIPIHHTNEIAQSESANDAPFARIWTHSEFLQVDGTKISKSKGNVFYLKDLTDRGFTALDLRMMIVQGHYRTESNFTWENVQSAANRLLTLRGAAELRWQPVDELDDISNELRALAKDFYNAIMDDLNTPMALESLAKAVKLVAGGVPKSSVVPYVELLQLADKALGLKLIEDTPDISQEQKQMIADRDKAKANKDFQTADKLRDALLQANIELLDTPYGALWQTNQKV